MAADLQTLLSKFLNDLYAGTLGVTMPITQVQGAAGSASAPTYAFTTSTNAGMFNGGGFPEFAVGGVARLFVATNSGGVTSNTSWGWSASTTDPTTLDTGLSRTAAGVVAVGNGTTGDVTGTVNATIFKSGASAGVTTFGPAGVVSITVKGGIITAIS